eukprot:scaffold19728_cov52-Phaeocystis_antarctica.AAC.1
MPPPPLPPAQPSPPLPPPSVKHVVLTLTASGSFSDYLDSRKSLKRKFADAAGVDKLLVTMRTRRGAKNQSAAASMLITVTIAVPVSMSADEVQTSLLFTLGTADAASTVLGVTIEEVLIVTVRAEPPSPPPPSPTPPPPPPPESPPALPPAPPRPPSTPSAGGGANSQVPVEALWALLPLCVLLVAALVLFHRYRARILRDRANAVLSRDRAHVDLQMMAHQVQKVQPPTNSSASSGSRLISLPPGPPSSSAASGYNTAPPHTWEGADRQHYAGSTSPGTAPPMAEQRATHPKWMEAGRQWFFPESTGAKRARGAL